MRVTTLLDWVAEGTDAMRRAADDIENLANEREGEEPGAWADLADELSEMRTTVDVLRQAASAIDKGEDYAVAWFSVVDSLGHSVDGTHVFPDEEDREPWRKLLETDWPGASVHRLTRVVTP